MEKKFEKPELIIVNFNGELATDDIITTSDVWENQDFPEDD